MKITIYGSGCAKCRLAEELVRRVVTESGAGADVVKVSDLKEIATAGIMATPAIAVDGVVKITGHVPTAEEVKQWIGG